LVHSPLSTLIFSRSLHDALPISARALANAHDGLAISDRALLRQALQQLSVQHLGFSRETVTAFSRMGLCDLARILEQPRDSLARRFPAEVLLQLDRLLGHRPSALGFYRPPDVFEQRIELNFEVESPQAVVCPVRRLPWDLAAYLAGRDSGVQRFILHLEHRAMPDSQVPVGLLSAERDASMLFELTRGRLEQLQLPAPVLAVRLIARELPRFAPAHGQLFEERPQQSLPWERLHERLRARLGDDAVQGLGIRADHRPEHAWSGLPSNFQPATGP